VLSITQDRLAEKDFVAALGCPVTRYTRVETAADLARAVATHGPGVLKTTRLGYDGKGQRRVDATSDLAAAVAELDQPVLVHEAWVDFALELSVITARSPQGQVASYVPVENRHRHHILDVTIAPAAIRADVAREAIAMAERIAGALRLEGLLAVEMFLARDGRLLVNELAPRPHNSGHWTIDACAVSQFEQQVRAVCGLPLGDPARLADAEMTNLIGDEVGRWPELLAEPGARLHLYGKREIRPGRKMGHVTRLRR
jgi:5-(carboxyamino)imidazole ribonucleotide synthase